MDKKVKEPVICLHCNEVCPNRTRNKLTFCSKTCFYDYSRNHPELHKNKLRPFDAIERWLKGEFSAEKLSPYIRTYLYEKADYKCSECSYSGVNELTGNTVLQIDHIDGNSLNQAPDNLRVLCPNCHAMTPTYGRLNKNSGRESRRKTYHKSKMK